MKPLENEPWCQRHSCKKGNRNKYFKTRKSRSCEFSPVNGFEPICNLKAWNKNKNLKESHNCFAYAMNAVDNELVEECGKSDACTVGFHQPGYASGYGKFSNQDEKGCGDMVARLWGDNPVVKASSFEERCPMETSKIALIVDPKRDYHFVRQDSDGYWSHKPGAMEVTRLDASKRPIIRPDKALFIYKNHKEPLIYTEFCGYFCVPRNKPVHMMTETRSGGSIEGGASTTSEISSRSRQTRRRSRDVSRR